MYKAGHIFKFCEGSFRSFFSNHTTRMVHTAIKHFFPNLVTLDDYLTKQISTTELAYLSKQMAVTHDFCKILLREISAKTLVNWEKRRHYSRILIIVASGSCNWNIPVNLQPNSALKIQHPSFAKPCWYGDLKRLWIDNLWFSSRLRYGSYQSQRIVHPRTLVWRIQLLLQSMRISAKKKGGSGLCRLTPKNHRPLKKTLKTFWDRTVFSLRT